MDRTYYSGDTTINIIDAGRVEDLSGLPPEEPVVVHERVVPKSFSAPASARPVVFTNRQRPVTVTRENPIAAALIGILATAIILAMILFFVRLAPTNTATALTSPTGACKKVRVVRQDIEHAQHISVRFRTEDGTGDVAGAAECIRATSGSVTAIDLEPTGGIKLRVKLERGAAYVSLPDTFVTGTADQVVCSRNASGEIVHRKYAISWSGYLPETMHLARLYSYNKATADAYCRTIL